MSAPKQPQDNTPELDQEQLSSAEETQLSTDANDETIQFPQESASDIALTEAQNKVADYYDQLLRAKAEMENIRRRAIEDIAKARKFAIEGFAESLIPVRDSLEAALAQEGQSLEVLNEGVETTLRQLNSAFERNKLIEIAPEVGDKFDPHQHQAISSVPSEHPKDAIAQVLQKGYSLSDRVLRPALVMVSAG